jgi:hypothetical protein
MRGPQMAAVHIGTVGSKKRDLNRCRTSAKFTQKHIGSSIKFMHLLFDVYIPISLTHKNTQILMAWNISQTIPIKIQVRGFNAFETTGFKYHADSFLFVVNNIMFYSIPAADIKQFLHASL